MRRRMGKKRGGGEEGREEEGEEEDSKTLAVLSLKFPRTTLFLHSFQTALNALCECQALGMVASTGQKRWRKSPTSKQVLTV